MIIAFFDSWFEGVPGKGRARKTAHTHPTVGDTPRSMASIETFIKILTNGLAHGRLAWIRSGGKGVYSYVTRIYQLPELKFEFV